MRGLVVGLGVLVGAGAGMLLFVAPDIEGAPRSGQECGCERFCVSVSPRAGDLGETVFRFKGRGWRPRRVVESLFGEFCPPGADCNDIGIATRLRTDARGRFTFKFREGPPRAGDRRVGIVSGGGPVTFEQWRGRPYRSRLIRRQPIYRVDY